MALPIAHAAAGYLVHRAARRVPSRGRTSAGAWRRAALFMVVGNLPDCDFVIGFVLGQPGLVHRGVSHTLAAAVVFGVIAGALARWRREPFRPAAFAFGAAYASHLLVDWLTVDSRPPIGGQFLWPFSSAYYIAPMTIFHEIHIDGLSRAGFVHTVLAWPTIVVLARESLLVLVAVAVWYAVEAGWTRLAALPAFEDGREDLA